MLFDAQDPKDLQDQLAVLIVDYLRSRLTSKADRPAVVDTPFRLSNHTAVRLVVNRTEAGSEVEIEDSAVLNSLVAAGINLDNANVYKRYERYVERLRSDFHVDIDVRANRVCVRTALHEKPQEVSARLFGFVAALQALSFLTLTKEIGVKVPNNTSEDYVRWAEFTRSMRDGLTPPTDFSHINFLDGIEIPGLREFRDTWGATVSLTNGHPVQYNNYVKYVGAASRDRLGYNCLNARAVFGQLVSANKARARDCIAVFGGTKSEEDDARSLLLSPLDDGGRIHVIHVSEQQEVQEIIGKNLKALVDGVYVQSQGRSITYDARVTRLVDDTAVVKLINLPPNEKQSDDRLIPVRLLESIAAGYEGALVRIHVTERDASLTLRVEPRVEEEPSWASQWNTLAERLKSFVPTDLEH